MKNENGDTLINLVLAAVALIVVIAVIIGTIFLFTNLQIKKENTREKALQSPNSLDEIHEEPEEVNEIADEVSNEITNEVTNKLVNEVVNETLKSE